MAAVRGNRPRFGGRRGAGRVEALGGLDVLVAAAGLWHPGVPGQIEVDDVRRVMDVNFTSTVLTNQAAAAVTAMAPAVETPGAERLRDFLGPDLAPVIEQQLQMTIPLGGKLGDPTADLGPVLVFLAGDGSRFITGQLIAVDDGLMMLGA